MSGNIFINYRRDDTSASAGRLYDRLSARFPKNQIFIDVDNLDPGIDFVEAIDQSVGSCDVLIAVIGKRWLISSEAEGRRRLDNPDDLVRLEIATALRRNIRVIPVLVDDASMPHASDLPDDLKSLVRRNAVEVSHTRFSADSGRLIAGLERVLGKTAAEQREREEKVRLEAERREREEKERIEEEHRQKEERVRLETEQRKKQREQREREHQETQRRHHEQKGRLEHVPQSQLARPVGSSTPPAQSIAKKPSVETPKRMLRWFFGGLSRRDDAVVARVTGVASLITYLLAMLFPAVSASSTTYVGWRIAYFSFPALFSSTNFRLGVAFLCADLANLLFFLGIGAFICRVFFSRSRPGRLTSLWISGLCLLSALASTILFVCVLANLVLAFHEGFFLWLLGLILLFLANLISPRRT